MTAPAIGDIGLSNPPAIESLPPRFQRKRLADFDPNLSPASRKGLAAATEYALAPGSRGLLLVGGFGAGKTHLAAGICNAVWDSDWRRYQDRLADMEAEGTGVWPPTAVMPRWANVPSLINRLRGGDDDIRAEARALGRYRGVVVLDDLGREKATEWTGETIYVLVNTRWELELPTVATTNLSIAELVDNGYGQAVSRLSDHEDAGRLIDMVGAPDYRARRGDA